MNIAAGGDESQIKVIDNDLGLFIVKVKGANTLSLNEDLYYCDVFIDAGSDSISINEAIRIIKTVKGSGDTTPSSSNLYMTYPKILRFSITDGVVSYLIREGWTIDPTVEEAGGIITVSSNAEFALKTDVYPYNRNCNYSYIDSSTIEIYPPDNYGTLVVEIRVP